MGDELLVVGKRLPRPDAPEKATGAALFIADLKWPGTLVGKVLRSPYPHAKILRVDASEAEKLPGVAAVITIEDVPQKHFTVSFADLPAVRRTVNPLHADQRIFNEKARFVGDAVAAVAAANETVAEEALGLIKVEYEILPAVFGPVEAMRAKGPKIHDFAEQNIAWHVPYPFSSGDVEKAFQEADCVVESDFSTSKQVHGQLETASAAASFDSAGRLTVWSPCQLPHIARLGIANIFSLPVSMVRLIGSHVGGSFGAKISLTAEPVCVALARKAGKPVRLEYTKEEDFVALETKTPYQYRARMGFKNDGTLTAIELKAIAHSGGYLGYCPLTAGSFLAYGMGLYRCPNRAGGVDIIYTNTTLSGAMRGFGNPEAMWGIEQLMDMAAEKLAMDPLEIRFKNIKKVGEPGSSLLPISSTALEECIKLGAQSISWQEKRRREEAGVKRRGVGVAIMSHSSGTAPSGIEHSDAVITFHEDGQASLFVHPGEAGTGILGVLAQIAAEELGLNAGDIHVVTGDTDVTPFDVGAKASRSTYVTGNAVLRAAQEAKARVLEHAARAIQVSPGELEVKAGRIYVRDAPEKGCFLADVVRDAFQDRKQETPGVSGKCSFVPAASSPPTQAAFAEVEVDTETGAVKVLKVVVAHDIGKAINPTTVEGQLQGAIVQGMGYALIEDFIIDMDTGKPITDSFQTYHIPTSLEVPEIETILVERGDPLGPFGAKSVGESGSVAIAPAIANAIYHAVGVRITELPITSEKILKLLKPKGRVSLPDPN